MATITHDNDCHWRLGHDCTCGAGHAHPFVTGARAEIQQRDWNAQTAALEAVRREARAEGMRMAADLFTGSDLWEEAGIREWILAAVQTAADSVPGSA